MPFVFKKILDKGASHPVVARLQIQVHELLNSTSLSKGQREALGQAAFDASMRLIRCYDIAERLRAECAQAEAEHEARVGSDAAHLPHVIGLEQTAETFLYEAKNFLRDVTRIVNAAFGTTFNEASQFTKTGKASKAKITKWADATLGPDERLAVFFRHHEGWIGEVINMRNAVEHPGGLSGTLHIVNYEPMPDGTIRRPVWHLAGEPTNRLLEEMDGLCDQMLEFADELIALVVERNLAAPFQIYEIPPENRDPQMPKSFIVSLAPDAMQKLREAGNKVRSPQVPRGK